VGIRDPNKARENEKVMKAADYLSWCEGLVKRFQAIPSFQCKSYINGIMWYHSAASQSWASEAGSALSQIFPPSHPCRLDWDRLIGGLRPSDPHGGTLERLLGVICGALQQLQDGRIGSLLDAIRVETQDELLDQATVLLDGSYLAAAAVIAGGTLETHLRRLVAKNGLSINGDGSIAKYDGEIAKARNTGADSIYQVTDSKLVTAWGGIRNEAAHTPGQFTRSADEVKRMIEGIREFISRTS
jgi:hypothetical protein